MPHLIKHDSEVYSYAKHYAAMVFKDNPDGYNDKSNLRFMAAGVKKHYWWLVYCHKRGIDVSELL